MSINFTPSTQFSKPGEKSSDQIFSFRDLIESLSAMTEAPTLEDVNNWMNSVQPTAEDVRPFRFFKTGTYARHRVFRNEFAELLVLCWKPGQRTPIHDHNGSFGAVHVCEGVMWETVFALNDAHELYYVSGREWNVGEETTADVPDIHQIGNPEVSGQDLITLHLYAPPLGVLNTYKVGSAEVGHYSPNEFMDGAGI